MGSEPTITQPLRSTVRAVVRPTPPGQPNRWGLIWANSETWPDGVTSTIVVPVPCTLALSLKLLTRTLPCHRCPVLRGMTATPYGLTSPLPGTVDASVVTWCNGPTNAGKPPALAAPATRPVPASKPAVAVTSAASAAA